MGTVGLTPVGAVEKLMQHYSAATATAVRVLESSNYADYAQVTYPKLTVEIHSWHPVDRTEPFGYVEEAGVYSAVISKPELLADYWTEQLERLSSNYDCTMTVTDSKVRIPPEYIDGLANHGRHHQEIPRPSLDDVDDAIIDGDWDTFHGAEKPLFYFTPQRFDIACARIEHYTGLPVAAVQKYILFTNYGMHTQEFQRYGLDQIADPHSRYTELLAGEPHYQMPRYDLIAPGNQGITMINIGVGPSNAKTITDCLAVLRPDAWVMIGHCAGLDGRMRIGDLILGNAYQRSDHVLDGYIPLNLPIPAIPEVQRALEASVFAIYGNDLSLMRTGTVLSTDDRNWEWHTPQALWDWLRASTAAACDMESATLAANGYRYRIPYGTLLSVSDLPLHAVPKLPAAARAFYSNSKQAHVMCAVQTMEQLAANPERLRTRKLRRTMAEVPFR